MDATRLDIRLKADTKNLIQQAAELKNQTVTQFVIATLSDAASNIVTEYQQTLLSNRDRDSFLRMLDTPPEPNAALRAADKEYRKRLAR